MLGIGLAWWCDFSLSWSCRTGVNTTPDMQDGPFVVMLVIIMILKDTTFKFYIYFIYYVLGTSLL